MTDPEDQRSKDAARALLAVFLGKDGEGQFVYEADEVRAFLPLVFLSCVKATGWEEAPHAVKQALAAFAQQIDFKGNDAAAFNEAIERHFRAHPPNEHLVKAFHRFMQEQLLEDAPAVANPFASVIGEQRIIAEKRPPGPNSVQSGPLAAFQLSQNEKD